MRRVPELMLRQQQGVISLQSGVFSSVEVTFHRALSHDSDYRELIPEFYAGNQEIYLNAENMDLGLMDPVADVELPLWARDSLHFCEIMREALESDYVSEHIHEWIDLIFGFKSTGKEAETSLNTFPESCYSDYFTWEHIKTPTEREAMKLLIREFGQCPVSLFAVPHQQRVFRWVVRSVGAGMTQTNSVLQLKLRIEQLQGQLQIMTDQQTREIRDLQEDQVEEIEAIKTQQAQKISKLRAKLESFGPRKIGKDTDRKGLRRNASLGVPMSFSRKLTGREFTKTHGYETTRPPLLPSVSSTINLMHKQLKPVTESPVTLTQTPLSTSRKGRRTHSTTPPSFRPITLRH